MGLFVRLSLCAVGVLAAGEAAFLVALEVEEAIAAGSVVGGLPRPRAGRRALLEVRLLGTFRVVRTDGVAVGRQEWRSVKNAALVRLLAAAGGAVEADDVTAALWPGTSRDRARASLRTACLQVRRAVGDEHLVRDGSTLALSRSWVDLDEALRHADRARLAHRAGGPAACLRAVLTVQALRLAPVRPGPADAPVVAARGAELEARLAAALTDAAECAVALGRWDDAVAAARAVLEADPYEERAVRSLMLAHAGRDEVALALREFAACRRRLADELGTDPGAETVAVHERVLRAVPVRAAGSEAGPRSLLSRSAAALLAEADEALAPDESDVLRLCAAGVPARALGEGLTVLGHGPGTEALAARALDRMSGLGLVEPGGSRLVDDALAAAVLARALPEQADAVRDVASRVARRPAAPGRPAARVVALPRRRPASPADVQTGEALDLLAQYRLHEGRAVAARARDAASAALADGDVGPWARAVMAEHVPAVLLGSGRWSADALAAAAAQAEAHGDRTAGAELAVMASLAWAPERPLALAATAAATARLVQGLRMAVSGQHWLAVRWLVESGQPAATERLVPPAEGPAGTAAAHPLLATLARHATAEALLAQRRPEEARPVLEALAADGAALLLRPQVAARLAAVTAPVDVRTAIGWLDAAEDSAGAEGEQPRERCLRLLARAAVRRAQGRLDEAAATAALAGRLARASGQGGLAAEAARACRAAGEPLPRP